MKPIAIKNNYGFYEIDGKPQANELASYYQEKYYKDCSSYNYKPLPIEVKAKQINASLLIHTLKDLGCPSSSSLVEIGFGEGFLLQAAKSHGFRISGIDYAVNQIAELNSTIKENVRSSASPFEDLLSYKSDIGVLCLKNVLEHMPNPIEVINKIYTKLEKDSLLVIEVPNDFSALQEYLIASELVDKEYWLCPPDHLSYFNEASLSRLLIHNGFLHQRTVGSFPIEVFLLGEKSNYIKNPDRGKSAHYARCLFDAFILDSYGMDALYNLYTTKEICNISRTITCIYRKP